uniref:Uncharacterized protein n=1 Tax=Ditylenchus dipsaci TaxID=166011 RepID=A0A915D9R8_9BILA
MALEAFEWKPSTSQPSHNLDLNELCSSWIANNISDPSINFPSSIQSSFQAQRPSHFLVWSLGLSFVTIISLCALVGILFMRFLQKKTFNTFITFFVSVGVGSLSGSAVFHLLPQVTFCF